MTGCCERGAETSEYIRQETFSAAQERPVPRKLQEGEQSGQQFHRLMIHFNIILPLLSRLSKRSHSKKNIRTDT
jgi:hypothetical protein